MPQRTLRFKIHQDGRVEETVEGFNGNACNSATKNIEDALGEVKVKNKASEGFISNQSEKLNQINNKSNKLNTLQKDFLNRIKYCTEKWRSNVR